MPLSSSLSYNWKRPLRYKYYFGVITPYVLSAYLCFIRSRGEYSWSVRLVSFLLVFLSVDAGLCSCEDDSFGVFDDAVGSYDAVF